MNKKSIAFIILMALLTTLALAGSIWVVLILAGPNSLTRKDIIPPDHVALEVVAAIACFLLGGGLWGLGIARLTKTDVTPMVISCALSWGLTTFVFSTALGLSLGLIFQFGATISLRTNYYYLLLIVPVIGLVTGINGWVVAGKLGLRGLKKIAGRNVGIAAALGFLSVSLVLQFGLGWEVGQPVPGKYEMLTLMHWCNIGAALAGGTAMGMVLVKGQVQSEEPAAMITEL